jgi:hypothetical protein
MSVPRIKIQSFIFLIYVVGHIFFKARIVELGKPPMLGNGYVTRNNTRAIAKQGTPSKSRLTVGSCDLYAVRAKAT